MKLSKFVKKKERANKPEEENDGIGRIRTELNPYATVPKTIRFPEDIAYQMDLYAARMNISVGRMLIAIMQDVLPLFEQDEITEKPIRQVAVYQTMKKGKVLSPVDEDELIERIKLASNRKKSVFGTE